MVINLTNDPIVFYRCVFKSANPKGELPQEWFSRAEAVNAPVLKNSEASLEGEAISIEPLDERRSKVVLGLKRIHVGQGAPAKGYSRASSAVMESIIHCTRIRVFLASNDTNSAERLIGLVQHYRDLTRKVSPYTEYSDIMEDLMSRIERWRLRYGKKP